VFLRHADQRPALIDAATGYVVTYSRLRTLVAEHGQQLDSGPNLTFLFADNSVRTVVSYLAALEQNHAVALLNPDLRPEEAATLIETYRPQTVIHPIDRVPGLPSSYRGIADGVARDVESEPSVNPDLAILLTTSGSTGSPKLVRLSRRNVTTNAKAIAASLNLTRAERAVTSLPLHYSYGMSVLNSHLLVGASVLVAEADLMAPDFWEAVAGHRATSLSGVPFTYQALHRIGFDSMDLPALTTLTQAGGKLDERLAACFQTLMRNRGGHFYVMYGQTEAAPRITCLPPDRAADKVGSAGVALPGTRVFVRTEGDRRAPPGVSGAVFCQGPNVMMGYAECRADLSLGDVQGDTLDTGDVGYLDEDGYLFLTGRTKRIAKVSGVRLSLDDVEGMLSEYGPVAVVASATERLAVFFVRVENLPILASGKTDYRALAEGAQA
jgi:acyl-coenzyme A synthetase/AMP-(fatty) acid ligase